MLKDDLAVSLPPNNAIFDYEWARERGKTIGTIANISKLAFMIKVNSAALSLSLSSIAIASQVGHWSLSESTFNCSPRVSNWMVFEHSLSGDVCPNPVIVSNVALWAHTVVMTFSCFAPTHHLCVSSSERGCAPKKGTISTHTLTLTHTFTHAKALIWVCTAIRFAERCNKRGRTERKKERQVN